MAALLTSVGDDKDKSALYLDVLGAWASRVRCRRTSTSPWASSRRWAPNIRFGLQAVRNVGHNVVDEIIKELARRRAPSPPSRTSSPSAPRRSRTSGRLESSSRVEPSTGSPSRGLMRIHEEYVDAFVAIKKQEAIGEDSSSGPSATTTPVALEMDMLGLAVVPQAEWDKQTLLSFEGDARPLRERSPAPGHRARPHGARRHPDPPRSPPTTPSPRLGDQVAGALSPACPSSGPRRATSGPIATVEDLAGSIECLFFPSAYLTVQTMLYEDTVVVVPNKVDLAGDSVSIYAEDLFLPETTDGPRGRRW